MRWEAPAAYRRPSISTAMTAAGPHWDEERLAFVVPATGAREIRHLLRRRGHRRIRLATGARADAARRCANCCRRSASPRAASTGRSSRPMNRLQFRLAASSASRTASAKATARKPSSISRTTSLPPTFIWRCARTIARSSTSSAIRRLGFGTDQGKLSNVNGFAIAADALGKSIPEVGTTTYRPAYSPVTFGTLAGAHAGDTFEPRRYSPMHAAHVARGAEFEPVGQWLRPWYFPKAGRGHSRGRAP